MQFILYSWDKEHLKISIQLIAHLQNLNDTPPTHTQTHFLMLCWSLDNFPSQSIVNMDLVYKGNM